MILDEEFSVDTLPSNGGGGGYGPLPPGWYDAIISNAELKNTKAGNGQYIAVRYDITGPTHQGRCIFGNLNIKNPNPMVEEIGRKQLGKLMRAIGLARVNDTDQLIGGQTQIKLTIKNSEQYGEGNEVKEFKAINSAIPAPAFAPAAAASTSAKAPPLDKKAPAPAPAPPWAKKAPAPAPAPAPSPAPSPARAPAPALAPADYDDDIPF